MKKRERVVFHFWGGRRQEIREKEKCLWSVLACGVRQGWMGRLMDGGREQGSDTVGKES